MTPQYGKLQDPNLNKGNFVFKIGKSVTQSSTASTATANSDLAAQAWEVVKDSTNPKILEEYIRMFPTAPQRNLAKLKLMTLESPSPAQSPEDRVTAQFLSGEVAKKKLFRDNECVGCDLKDINMKGLYLWKADLRRANLMKADLRAVDLTEANLTNAMILGANTVGAKFCKTTMPDGSINNRDCEKAQTGTNQSSSVVSGEAAKKKLLETKECVGCDLQEVVLRGVNLISPL